MNIRGMYTLFTKEVRRFIEIWKSTIISPMISNILFMVVFGVALAGRVSSFEEYDYLQVLVPGLVAMGILMNAYNNPVFSLILAKYTNIIHDLLRIPLKGFEIVFTYISAGLLRGVIIGIATYIAGIIFVDVPIVYPGILFVFTILIGATMSSLGAAIGVLMPNFDKANNLYSVVLMPLIYIGGVFFSITSLPEKFQVIAKLNPLFYMIDGFRYGFLGVSDVDIQISLIVTFICFAICFSLASWIFHTGYKLRV